MSAGSGRIIRTIIAQENCPAMPHGCWCVTAWAVQGGTGSQSLLLEQPEELPDRFESGTVNTPGICGLRAGMEWVMNKGIDKIGQHEIRLMAALHDRLSEVPGVVLYTPRPRMEETAPVLSLNVGGLSSEETAMRLDPGTTNWRKRLPGARSEAV